MSRDREDITKLLDRLSHSVKQCKAATQECTTVFSGSTVYNLPDLTDYLKECQYRNLNNFPLRRPIPDDDLNNSSTNAENDDPNTLRLAPGK